MKGRRYKESKNPKAVTGKNRRIMLLSKCAALNSTKSKFIEKEEARGLISKLRGIKVPILIDLHIANILF